MSPHKHPPPPLHMRNAMQRTRSGLAILVKATVADSSSLFSPFTAFAWELWLILVVTSLAMGVLLWCCDTAAMRIQGAHYSSGQQLPVSNLGPLQAPAVQVNAPSRGAAAAGQQQSNLAVAAAAARRCIAEDDSSVGAEELGVVRMQRRPAAVGRVLGWLGPTAEERRQALVHLGEWLVLVLRSRLLLNSSVVLAGGSAAGSFLGRCQPGDCTSAFGCVVLVLGFRVLGAGNLLPGRVSTTRSPWCFSVTGGEGRV